MNRFVKVLGLSTFCLGLTFAQESPVSKSGAWFPDKISIVRSCQQFSSQEKQPQTIAIQDFVNWFHPQQKGIAFPRQVQAIYFIVRLPEIDRSYSAGITICEIPQNIAQALDLSLRQGKSWAGLPYKAPTCQIARIYSNRYLVLLTSPSSFLEFNQRLLDHIDQYIWLQ